MKKLDDAAGPVDLKATVTLSGEALAALLEEVKNARAGASPQSEPIETASLPTEPEPAEEVLPAAEPAAEPPLRSWNRRFFR